MAKFSLDKTASYLLPVAEISAVFISRTYANWRVFFMTNTPFPLPKKEKISRRKKKKKQPTFETRMWPLIIRTCLRICGWTAEGGDSMRKTVRRRLLRRRQRGKSQLGGEFSAAETSACFSTPLRALQAAEEGREGRPPHPRPSGEREGAQKRSP